MATGDGIIISDKRPEDDDEKATGDGMIISGERPEDDDDEEAGDKYEY
jgi:hypothetical protein